MVVSTSFDSEKHKMGDSVTANFLVKARADRATSHKATSTQNATRQDMTRARRGIRQTKHASY